MSVEQYAMLFLAYHGAETAVSRGKTPEGFSR